MQLICMLLRSRLPAFMRLATDIEQVFPAPELLSFATCSQLFFLFFVFLFLFFIYFFFFLIKALLTFGKQWYLFIINRYKMKSWRLRMMEKNNSVIHYTAVRIYGCHRWKNKVHKLWVTWIDMLTFPFFLIFVKGHIYSCGKKSKAKEPCDSV